MIDSPAHTKILGTRLDAISWEQILGRIVRWSGEQRSRVICLCNVHTVTIARHNPALRDALGHTDINLPDGAPVAWLMRRRDWPEQQRISGPDLMWRVLSEAEKLALPVFLLGSTPATLGRLRRVLMQAFPKLILAGSVSPPFRPQRVDEQQKMVANINRSGARIVLVGLGCPKQEIWMSAHRDSIKAVMIGVGAAFDYHAGRLQRAPAAWQRMGLEWLHRLLQEPRRLMQRYLLTNTLFLLALPFELWRSR
ncbi:MAG: WecB/TagA/CpsF family glycosyltransferase [Burkholderiaceae bacterium]